MEENILTENILAEKIKNISPYILNYVLSSISHDTLIDTIKSNENVKIRLIKTWQNQYKNEFISIEKNTKEELEKEFEKLYNQLGKEKFYLFLSLNPNQEINSLKNKIDIKFINNEKNDLIPSSIEKFREIIRNKDRIINNLHQKNDYFFQNIKEKNKEIAYLTQEINQLKTNEKNLNLNENKEEKKENEIVPESIQKEKPIISTEKEKNFMDKYKQIASIIIFDVNGGIIKTGEAIITLSHQEMKRTNTFIGDNVLIAYNQIKQDEWGRYIGKIIKKIDFQETTETNFQEEKTNKELSIQEIANIMEITSIPQKTFIKILDDFKFKYTLIQNNFVFLEDIKEIVKQVLDKVEIFEICDSENCKKYCQEENFFYKNISKWQQCDICSKFEKNVIEKIINKSENILERQKIVLISNQVKLKYCYISEYKKIGIDIWWHDGIHELHRLDGIIKNCNGVLFLYNNEILYNSFKKTEIICNHYQKKMIKINYVGFNKVKKAIEENFIKK
ncbi:MAG: hypothetical protein ABIB46_05435 [bacterium]